MSGFIRDSEMVVYKYILNGRNNTSITEVPLKEMEYHDL